MTFLNVLTVVCWILVVLPINESRSRHLDSVLKNSSRESIIVTDERFVNDNEATVMKCNGLEDLCDLRLDQITLAGSHNAGSGFDGILHYWIGLPASSCLYRNHQRSFSAQLEIGLRFFDIDTCYGETEALNCHCTIGEGCAYGGSIEKGLSEINDWMKSHPSEVIVIHFNHDVQDYKRAEMYESIKNSLLKFWSPNTSGNLAMNSFYKSHGLKWPVLKDAVSSNERVFVFMDDILYHHADKNYGWLVRSNELITSTWDINPVSATCSSISINAKKKCDINTTFIDLSAFGSYGLCKWDMATVCSKWLGEAGDACYELREKSDRTVNFLLVDWSQYYSGKESVINKAKFMHQKNIKKYLGKSIFFPELTGCSFHSTWLGNYCWKYCSKYGWCWINVSCNSDPHLCQGEDYPCYSGCGY